jgi:hypothetical protein
LRKKNKFTKYAVLSSLDLFIEINFISIAKGLCEHMLTLKLSITVVRVYFCLSTIAKF